MLATLLALGGAILVAAAAPQPFDVGSYNVTILYSPPGAWSRYLAPGGFEGTGNATAAYFSYSLTNLSAVNWTTSYPTVTFEWWGYPRVDGGNATISFDDGPPQAVDYYNQSWPNDGHPILLYSAGALSPAVHKVYIRNQVDVRVTTNGGYGHLNVDHFVIIPVVAVPTASPTMPTSSSSPTSTTSHSSTPAPVVQTSSNNAGAIAGGVVGGVAGLALIAVALFFMRRRGSMRGGVPPLMVQTTGYPPSDGRSATPRPGGYWGPNPSSNGGAPIYDPNNPSTFPPPMTPAPLSATASPGQGSQPQQFPPEL